MNPIEKKGLVIEMLKEHGTSLKCYKIILNCHDYNTNFYNKCDFETVGVEMKYTR
jgi:glucosamine-phosphate N-acetyltransferase